MTFCCGKVKYKKAQSKREIQKSVAEKGTTLYFPFALANSIFPFCSNESHISLSFENLYIFLLLTNSYISLFHKKFLYFPFPQKNPIFSFFKEKKLPKIYLIFHLKRKCDDLEFKHALFRVFVMYDMSLDFGLCEGTFYFQNRELHVTKPACVGTQNSGRRRVMISARLLH